MGNELAATEVAKTLVYPGERSSPTALVELADEYFQAAEMAIIRCKPGRPISTAPYRLLCIHAIELYLNAFLRHEGQPAPAVRGLQHHLSARMRLTDAYGLVLRHKTRRHLQAVSENREYLVSRYSPEAAQLSELNRLNATLAEVRGKVMKRLIEPRTGPKVVRKTKADALV